MHSAGASPTGLEEVIIFPDLGDGFASLEWNFGGQAIRDFVKRQHWFRFFLQLFFLNTVFETDWPEQVYIVNGIGF